MHALLVSTGTAGNMLPFIGFGAALRERGHDVTVIGSGAGIEAVRQEGLGHVDLDGREAGRDLPAPDATGAGSRAFLRSLGPHAVRHMRRAYQLIAERYVPGETVVVSPGWLFGARIAQEKLGVPLATVHLYPLAFRSAHDKVTWPRWAPLALRRALFWALDRAIDRHFGAAINAFRSRLGLPPASRVLSRWWNSPQLVLGLFPDWLSAPLPDWPANTVLTGFPLYDDPRPFGGERELDGFLAAGGPPLVFSHSSAVLDARRFFTASIAVAQSLGCRAVLLTPHGEQVPRPLPIGVRHFPFVPHSRLLPHAVALVHHGGICTAFQALAAGVPQLIVPTFLDQPDNGRRFTQLGVAATVGTGTYRPREVSRKLDHLLGSDAVVDRCREYARRCREANAAEKACVAR
jgi:rhamnosyltransferase subunit B